MSRIVIITEVDRFMPIYFPAVILRELYRKDAKIGYIRQPFNGEIPKSAHVMQQMDNKEEMANAVCNVCMGGNVEWVCVNRKHVPIEPLGFHLCNECYNRIQDKVDSALRIPLATVVGT